MTISADELVRVIKACRKANVTELKIGDIEVKFAAGEAEQISKVGFESPTISEDDLVEVAKKVNIGENIAEAEERLDLLQIDDPSLYEQLVVERELEDNGKSTEVTEH